jgi:hypothetical protein
LQERLAHGGEFGEIYARGMPTEGCLPRALHHRLH